MSLNVRNAPAPAAAHEPAYTAIFTKKTLLVPVDGSERALEALVYAQSMCYKPDDNIIILALYSDIDVQRAEQHAQASINDAMKLFQGLDIRHKVVIKRATNIAEEIVRSADMWDASGIVMGARGLGPLTALLMGSTSDYVVRNASVPVTIVRRKGPSAGQASAAS
jgi:nucleotide-binding universal stress UspA family protein